MALMCSTDLLRLFEDISVLLAAKSLCYVSVVKARLGSKNRWSYEIESSKHNLLAVSKFRKGGAAVSNSTKNRFFFFRHVC